jgi:hypothetical protein
MGEHLAYEVREGWTIVVVKSEVMSLFGRPTCGWKHFIMVYVAEWESVIVVHDSYQCRDLASAVVA